MICGNICDEVGGLVRSNESGADQKVAHGGTLSGGGLVLIQIHVYGLTMRRFTVIAFAVMIMGMFPTLPATAVLPMNGLVATDVRVQEAKKNRKGKVCPTKNFWLGAGWGADRGKRTHMGVDMGGKRGTPIFAVEAGRIDRTKRQSNGALQIVLRGKSGSKYYYGHMDKVLIKGGQKIKKGQVIGKMGDSGSAGEVHLHFEFWKSGGESAAINPIKFLKRVCKSI